LIFAGAHRTDRLDLGPGPEFPVIAQQHLSPQDSDDIAIRVESALLSNKGSAQVGKSVWILWEGAISQMLDMAAGIVEGLEAEELAGALSFEAEPLTGITSADSAIDGFLQQGFSNVTPDLKRYWITQISAATRKRLEDAVHRFHARLAGIAHPGGLPRSLVHGDAGAEASVDVAATDPWQRIEVWEQVIFSLRGNARGADTRLIRATSGADWWSAELPEHGSIEWLGPLPANRIGPGGRRTSDAASLLHTAEGIPVDTARIDFSADRVPVEWLRAWAAELTAKNRRVPVIVVRSQISPNRRFQLTGGIAAGLVLAAAVGRGLWLSGSAKQATERAVHLDAQRAAFVMQDPSAGEVQKLNADIAVLQDQRHDLEHKEADLTIKLDAAQKIANAGTRERQRVTAIQAVHRRAVPALLAALSDAENTEDPGEIVIKDVRQDGNGNLRLTGLCRDSVLADTFANRLGARLRSDGWEVEPAQKHRRADLSAFDFVVELVPTILIDPSLGDAPASPIAPARVLPEKIDSTAGQAPAPGGHS